MNEKNDQLNLFPPAEPPVTEQFDADAVTDHIKAATDTPEHHAAIDQIYPSSNYLRPVNTEAPSHNHPSAHIADLPMKQEVHIVTVPAERERPQGIADARRKLDQAKKSKTHIQERQDNLINLTRERIKRGEY